jgi:nicotinamide mononucleotide transporter
VSSRWLAAETGAAWPFLDSVTTWASLIATWLVVRMKLENWVYWIAIDVVLTYLFIAQKLPFIGLLFATYLGISVVGFATWLRSYRLQARPV